MAGGPADGALDLFKSLVFDQLVKAAIAQIIGLAPFLSFGPIAFIITQVVMYVSGVLYTAIRDTINLDVILLKNAEYHRAFVNAQIELNAVAKREGITSPAFLQSRKEHADALAKFVRYSGTL